ncbi:MULTISPECIES: hypothetical protein [unclassified Microcoleus]|nr:MULTISPECIES: hypothetical protein [unclassified Microcoleus]MCC3432129.1 hypothetical protein [Microcoleus sp. PH2017_04_SCI_O_A]MCC3467715.1 hypothetical protein [Microcoleus sp. PH2017_06_SFM_O_A]MCC3415648.1 hypothetical protein [Microcoleus sp. PH2017_02_FOX_O_A]MCC3436361.1 hypothetical protein [Microcoleus sp. PH2017_05_CCC_O_A]MCC3449598.1 hypothetical protein [Microcoleus sp. PH2017_09_SFU_O_A]
MPAESTETRVIAINPQAKNTSLIDRYLVDRAPKASQKTDSWGCRAIG